MQREAGAGREWVGEPAGVQNKVSRLDALKDEGER